MKNRVSLKFNLSNSLLLLTEIIKLHNYYCFDKIWKICKDPKL